MSSQALSISAWIAVLDWPSMVARVEGVAPRAGQQVGGPQEHRRPVVEGQIAPGRRGLGRRGQRGARVVGGGVRRHPEDVAVALR